MLPPRCLTRSRMPRNPTPAVSPEAIFNEHRETTRGRDLDITGLSYSVLERDGPQQWPYAEGARSGCTRLYADGVFRSLGGRLDVQINGRRRPGVGRICMDQFLVDLGPGQVDVAEGDEAILFGPGTRGEPTAQDWADLIGTIHYEVVTSPRGRITRTYREAEPVER